MRRFPEHSAASHPTHLGGHKMLHLATSALAFSQGRPAVQQRPVAAFTPVSQQAAQRAAPLPLAATFASIPGSALAYAAPPPEDGSIVDTLVNAGLTVVVLGFVAFIGSYIFQAVAEVGNQAGKIAEYDREMAKTAPKKKMDPKAIVFDDIGSGAVSDEQVKKELEFRKKRGPGSKQVGSDGKRLAPWMNIDEKRIEGIKKERREERNRKKMGM